MNIRNWFAAVGMNKLIYAKQLHRICIILSTLFQLFLISEFATNKLNITYQQAKCCQGQQSNKYFHRCRSHTIGRTM
jgi:hypothetical protein